MILQVITKKSLIPLLLILSSLVYAQTNHFVDSLNRSSLSHLNDSKRLDKLINLIDSLHATYPDLCLEYAEEVIDLANRQNKERVVLEAKIKKAQIYQEQSDYNHSLELAHEVKEFAEAKKYPKQQADALLLIGFVYANLGEYDKSSEYNFDALRIYDELDDQQGISKTLASIGDIYFEQKKYNKALEYNQNSLSISKQIHDTVGIARGLNNIAAIYGNLGEFENFENYIRQALIINQKRGVKRWEGINYLNLAIINRTKSRFDSAFYFYQKAEQLFIKVNDLPKLSAVYTHFSAYYQELNELDSSLFFARKSYRIAKENKLKTAVYHSAVRLHRIYRKINIIDSAYKYSREEAIMKDSIDIESSNNRLVKLELLYEFEKQEQIQEKEKEKEQFFILLSAIITVFIFVFIIVVLIARHRLKVKSAFLRRKELESEIDGKNKELTSNVMSLMRKNEILSEIAEKLLQVMNEAVKDETKLAIQKIAKELHQSTDKEIWEEFDVRFQQVHSNFYERLLLKYPHLSPSEQRLCAFLKLNMTTKEISELTGQRTNSLEIARSRLRKKLGINNTKENLVSFLSRI